MTTIAVVGLGYVGLPLVFEYGKTLRAIGFDIDAARASRCQSGSDPSREMADADMRAATHA